MKRQITAPIHLTLIAGLMASGATLAGETAAPAAKPADTAAAAPRDYSVGEVISESIFGDVYSEPSKWEDLGFRNLFSKGWDKPWASPPKGANGQGAPRQGWLNAYDGVFFRLSIATFGWQHGLNGGDGYTGTLTSYTPLNQRLEIQTDIPMVAATRSRTDAERQANFGDFQITPRLMLYETQNVTQVLNVSFRTPTGNSYNGNGVAAVTPNYQFWANWWKGLVVRGGAGFTVPYSGDISQAGARSTFNGNIAIGYYFTDHDWKPVGDYFTPLGDMVWYLSTNFTQALDNRGPQATASVSLTPGFRTHVGANWYLLGAVEVPVTTPQPFDYQVLGGIMKVY
jgi:hypothetical protein